MTVGFDEKVTVHHVPAYSEIYGQHPRTFVFAHDGSKLQVDSPPPPDRRTKYPAEHSLALCEMAPCSDDSSHRRSMNVSRIYPHHPELTGIDRNPCLRPPSRTLRPPLPPPSEPTGSGREPVPSESVKGDDALMFCDVAAQATRSRRVCVQLFRPCPTALSNKGSAKATSCTPRSPARPPADDGLRPHRCKPHKSGSGARIGISGQLRSYPSEEDGNDS